MQAERMVRTVCHRLDVNVVAVGDQLGPYGSTGGRIRQCEEKVHVVGFEGVKTLRAHTLDHLRIPVIGAGAAKSLQTEIDSHQSCEPRRNQRDQDPVHGKSGLRFSRKALIPSSPSTLAACAAIVSASSTICDSNPPNDWAMSRFTLPT